MTIGRNVSRFTSNSLFPKLYLFELIGGFDPKISNPRSIKNFISH
jgi:hypothetical protein